MDLGFCFEFEVSFNCNVGTCSFVSCGLLLHGRLLWDRSSNRALYSLFGCRSCWRTSDRAGDTVSKLKQIESCCVHLDMDYLDSCSELNHVVCFENREASTPCF
jgi:hypothetical protein